MGDSFLSRSVLWTPHCANLSKCKTRGGGTLGKACVKKSLHIALSASLDLTFGIHACLCAPFNASAVIKSLIKLMSDLPREPGVGEKYDCGHRQPSASNMLMLQAISSRGPSHQAALERAAHSRGWLRTRKQDVSARNLVSETDLETDALNRN